MTRTPPDRSTIPKYLPEFWTRFWLSGADGPLLSSRPPRLYRYDVYDNDLNEITEKDLKFSLPEEPKPSPSKPSFGTSPSTTNSTSLSSSRPNPSPCPFSSNRTIFQDLDFPTLLDPETRKELDAATEAFAALERDVEVVLTDLLQRTAWSNGHHYGSLNSGRTTLASLSGSLGTDGGGGGFGSTRMYMNASTSHTSHPSVPLPPPPTNTSLPFDAQAIDNVKKYLLFLRFRNSAGYAKIVESLEADEVKRGSQGSSTSSTSTWSSSSTSSTYASSSTSIFSSPPSPLSTSPASSPPSSPIAPTTPLSFDNKHGYNNTDHFSTFGSRQQSEVSSPARVKDNSSYFRPQEQNINLKLYPAYRPYILLIRLRVIFRKFTEFLKHTAVERQTNSNLTRAGYQCSDTASTDYHGLSRGVDWQSSGNGINSLQEMMSTYCWKLCDAFLCVGVATEDQEFMFSDRGFGTLDEGYEEDPHCENLCFPIFPTLSIYIISPPARPRSSTLITKKPTSSEGPVWIQVSTESAIDVHLRNAMLLQTYPHYLFFRCLRSVTLSISSYDEFRWIQEHQDYSRLKQRCRQRFVQESVTKTLVVRDSREEGGASGSGGRGGEAVTVRDLSDEIVVLGDSAVGHGAFSDVWKGAWYDALGERKHKTVALKFLRQIVVQNIREKLLRRLQTEIVAWHRVSHENVIQFFGIVQAPMGIAMVSPWCDNGTTTNFLKLNPGADRLKLLSQAAAGVAYLHAAKPMIVHGDLRAGNILVDEQGRAIINDFGLSKVIEDLKEDGNGIASSFFSGSTRWMAPELIIALVEDEDNTPPITPQSDVYSFGCVCLEFATDSIPYPKRTNNHAVTVDIIHGVKPKRGPICLIKLGSEDQEDAFWCMVERCWDSQPCNRPTMDDILAFLQDLQARVTAAS